jgi:hypothetical protein
MGALRCAELNPVSPSGLINPQHNAVMIHATSMPGAEGVGGGAQGQSQGMATPQLKRRPTGSCMDRSSQRHSAGAYLAASRVPSGKPMLAGTVVPWTTQRQFTEDWGGGVKLVVPTGSAVGASRVPVNGTRCK